MIESITQVIVSLDGFFKKSLIELMLLNGFFIYNNNFNIFYDTSTSIIFIDFKIYILIKKKNFSTFVYFF